MTAIALLLIGYSIFSAITLALTHFRVEHYPDQWMSRISGWVFLLALSGLQVAHFGWLYLDQPWVASIPYRMTLFAVAPAVFLFSQPLLRPQTKASIEPRLLGHLCPVLISPFLPSGVALPLAFIVGSGYLLWLGRSLYALRRERAGFQREMILLGGVFAIALGVSVLGWVQAALADKLFFSCYAIAIGMAFFLVQTALGLRPKLSVEVRETVQTAYASSTLANVDCDAVLARLDRKSVV